MNLPSFLVKDREGILICLKSQLGSVEVTGMDCHCNKIIVCGIGWKVGTHWQC